MINYTFYAQGMAELLSHWGNSNEEAVGYINEGRKSIPGQRFERYVEEKVHEGIKKGALLEKQTVLLRMMDKKFSLTPGDEELVRSCTDLNLVHYLVHI